jgi:hypothetical protein
MILPMAKIQRLSQASKVRVSQEDVARGHVDVELGSHVEVRSNSRCRIAFRSTAAWFTAVKIHGFPRTVEFGPAGGCFVRPLECHRTSSYLLSYRFLLHPSTLPGTYTWPFSMVLTPDWDEAPLRPPVAALRMPPARPS